MVTGFWAANTPGTPANMNACMFQSAVFASRPAAAQLGILFFATDTFDLYKDNGATWDLVGRLISTGAQTLTGVKTFGSIPVGPGSNPTTANQLARKKYIDDLMHGCHALRNSNQAISSGLITDVDLTFEDFDTDAIHDTATNPEKFTVKTAGVYFVWAAIVWAPNATGHRKLKIRDTGNETLVEAIESSPDGADETKQYVAFVQKAAVNDVFNIECNQNSGGSLNLVDDTGGQHAAEAGIHRIGP